MPRPEEIAAGQRPVRNATIQTVVPRPQELAAREPDVPVHTTPGGMQYVRTPEERFENLAGFPYRRRRVPPLAGGDRRIRRALPFADLHGRAAHTALDGEPVRREEPGGVGRARAVREALPPRRGLARRALRQPVGTEHDPIAEPCLDESAQVAMELGSRKRVVDDPHLDPLESGGAASAPSEAARVRDARRTAAPERIVPGLQFKVSEDAPSPGMIRSWHQEGRFAVLGRSPTSTSV